MVENQTVPSASRTAPGPASMHSALVIPSDAPSSRDGSTARRPSAKASRSAIFAERSPLFDVIHSEPRPSSRIANALSLGSPLGRSKGVAVFPRRRHTVMPVLTHIDPLGPAAMALTVFGALASPGHTYGTSASPWTWLSPPGMEPTQIVPP